MQIDSRSPWLAAAAVAALEEVAIPATSTQVLVAVSDDQAVTQVLVHRVTVPSADETRARELLAERGLLDPWWLVPASG